jgi:hypothetical protein
MGMGEKSGVKNCHQHRLRHTFAIKLLQNGGNVFTLKMLLGHSNLDMVQTYANLAKMDLKNIHRWASSADKRRLQWCCYILHALPLMISDNINRLRQTIVDGLYVISSASAWFEVAVEDLYESHRQRGIVDNTI